MISKPRDAGHDGAQVIDLSKYRRGRRPITGPPRGDAYPADGDPRTYVYITLEFDGRVSYGVKRANVSNALTLLRPLLHLGSELLRIYLGR